jgi:hypothetical protein
VRREHERLRAAEPPDLPAHEVRGGRRLVGEPALGHVGDHADDPLARVEAAAQAPADGALAGEVLARQRLVHDHRHLARAVGDERGVGAHGAVGGREGAAVAQFDPHRLEIAGRHDAEEGDRLGDLGVPGAAHELAVAGAAERELHRRRGRSHAGEGGELREQPLDHRPALAAAHLAPRQHVDHGHRLGAHARVDA